MFVFKLGKKIYMAADRLRSNEDNCGRIAWGLLIIFIAAIIKMLWPIESWEDLSDAAILCCVAIYIAVKIAEVIFDDKLNKICRQFSRAAKAYDLCMLARVRIGHSNKSKPMASGKEPGAEVGIEYFIEQEKANSLYHAISVRKL